jgi:PAS domain-containing protein
MPDTDSPADENDEKTLLEARVRALEIDLRQKKEIILAQHTQLEAFSGSSIDALVQMDFDGHITGWNKQAEKIFGWAADDHETVSGKRRNLGHGQPDRNPCPAP